MSDAWSAAGDVGNFVFGDKDSPGLLGTGEHHADAYSVNDNSFVNQDSEANQRDIAYRRNQTDARKAPTMSGTAVAGNERAGSAQTGPAAQGSLALANGQNINRGEDAEMREYQTALAQQLLQQTQGKGPAFDLANNSYRTANEQAVKNMMGVLSANGAAVNPALAQRGLLNAQENIETQNAQNLAADKLRAQMAAQQQLGGVVTGARAQDIGVNTDQANLLQQTALANMGASNDMSKFNSGQFNDLAKFNAAQRQQSNIFNAGETNDTNALQAQLDMQTKQANLEAYFKQMGMNDDMAKYYTDRQLQLDEADRAAQMAKEQLQVTNANGMAAVDSKDYSDAAQRIASTTGSAVDTGVGLATQSDINSKQNIMTVSSEDQKTDVRKSDQSRYSDAEVKAAIAWKKRMDQMQAQRKEDSKPGQGNARLGHALGNLFGSIVSPKPGNADSVLADMQNQQAIRNAPLLNSMHRGFETGAIGASAMPNAAGFASSAGGASALGSQVSEPAPVPSESEKSGYFASALMDANAPTDAGAAMRPGVSMSSFDMKTGIAPASANVLNGNGMDVLGSLKATSNFATQFVNNPAGQVIAGNMQQPGMVLSDERAKKDAFEAGVLYADASSAQHAGQKVDGKYLDLPDYVKPKKGAESGFTIRAVDRDEPGMLSPNPSNSPHQKLPDANAPKGFRYTEPMQDGAPNRTSAQVSPAAAELEAQRALAAQQQANADRPFFDHNFMQQFVDDPGVRRFADFMAPIAAGPIGGAVYGIRRSQRDYDQATQPQTVSSDERLKTGVSAADAGAFGADATQATQQTASPSLGDQTFTGSYQAKQEQSGFQPDMQPKLAPTSGGTFGGTQNNQDPWTKRASYIDNLRQQQAPAAPGSGEVARYGGSTMRPQRDAAIDRAHADQVAQYQSQLSNLGQQLQEALRRMREAEQRASAASTVQPIVQAAKPVAAAPAPAETQNSMPTNTVSYGGGPSGSTLLPGAKPQSSNGYMDSNTGLPGAIKVSNPTPTYTAGSGNQSVSYTPSYSPTTSYSSGSGTTRSSWTLSDERQKTDKRAARDPDVQQFIDTLVPSTYDYKNPDMPGAGRGRQFGLMAQDLERTKLGKSAVKEDENGTKVVDYGKLGGINMALGVMNAQHNDQQDERIINLEKALKLAAKRRA